MEREISMFTEIATILISVSVLLSIVVYLVMTGWGIQNDASEEMTKLNEGLGYDFVESLARGEFDNEMPSVTAFNILTKYNHIITWSANLTVSPSEVENSPACKTAKAENHKDKDIICSGIRNLQLHGSDITENMKGRVQLEIIPTYGNTFIAVIHPENSTWRSGEVDSSCEYVQWYDELIAEQGLDRTWVAKNRNGCSR